MSYFDDNEARLIGLPTGNALHRFVESHSSTHGYDPKQLTPKKENSMDLEQEARRLEKQAKRLRKKAKREELRLAAFGPEGDHPIGTVFAFTKTYAQFEAPVASYTNRQQSVKYLYAAIRTKIGWTVTSTINHAHKAMKYSELLEFIGDSPCGKASSWETIQ